METKDALPTPVATTDDTVDPNTPAVGTVRLRGVAVALATDVAAAFVTDCARHLEGALSDAEIKSKWGLA